jgi:transposase InsO family protein
LCASPPIQTSRPSCHTTAYCPPGTIRTDNDAAFTSRLFRLGLRWLGVQHRLSQPGCPWQNCRVERLFGTLKEKLNQFAVPDFCTLERMLAEFRFWYNAVRPHQHLNLPEICAWTLVRGNVRQDGMN